MYPFTRRSVTAFFPQQPCQTKQVLLHALSIYDLQLTELQNTNHSTTFERPQATREIGYHTVPIVNLAPAP